ncbi:bifunctional DNA-formamidopyrimidine glycosylase/DNA-(apurinic or apyrimidinic site) lyase [Candidatus Tisiphia endosymbiont of Nemotelus uliginosus]|uniref:bifunctional DNA-formamidopyrimidine glycosylase/DNA-(apurinic or apyrimidinic site) lyase n=1 Tax=Candidatus Tisiphia endosymbiont of Nemotelus uliginosus TaxID=3077926 RepID=UPI0035C8EEB7
MPELPEVETLKRSLESTLVNNIIDRLEKRRDNIRYRLSNSLEQDVKAAKIIMLRRRAKYLIIDLDNAYSIIIHLGMSGRLSIQSNDYSLQKHDHIIFYLRNDKKLVFNDSRRFGMIYTIRTYLIETQFFHNIGLEPLSSNVSVTYLKEKFLKRNMPIKNLLMDNQIMVGIGNIYASESLFLAKIHPCKPSNTLTDEEINRLILAVQQVLTNSIAAGGTTLKDFVNGDNKAGYFQQQLQVYARYKQQCLYCNMIIEKIKQAGRTTFFCSGCQK